MFELIVDFLLPVNIMIEFIREIPDRKSAKFFDFLTHHTGLKADLSREVCPPKEKNMDNCYMMSKDVKNVNGNPG